MTTSNGVVPSSFRDPSGVLFWKDGVLYRPVSVVYRANCDHLMEVGLHDSLVMRDCWFRARRCPLTMAQPISSGRCSDRTLALVHHLAIGNNLPLMKVVAFFSKICDSLVMEFVAKGDSQAQRLLETRESILQDYTEQSFLDALDGYFAVEGSVGINGMDRTSYLLRQKGTNA